MIIKAETIIMHKLTIHPEDPLLAREDSLGISCTRMPFLILASPITNQAPLTTLS
jgi:hypothetical protein